MDFFRLCCPLIALLGSGCAAFDPGVKAQEQPSLMPLWNTYVHCRESHDPDRMWADSRRLREAARKMTQPQPSLWLSEALGYAVSEMPSRLSVDPNAMAADCSLRAGRAARDHNRLRLAVTLFNHIAATYPVERYGYYVDRASRMLGEEALIGRPKSLLRETTPLFGSMGGFLPDEAWIVNVRAINSMWSDEPTIN
jgi:hypothetical protein